MRNYSDQADVDQRIDEWIAHYEWLARAHTIPLIDKQYPCEGDEDIDWVLLTADMSWEEGSDVSADQYRAAFGKRLKIEPDLLPLRYVALKFSHRLTCFWKALRPDVRKEVRTDIACKEKEHIKPFRDLVLTRPKRTTISPRETRWEFVNACACGAWDRGEDYLHDLKTIWDEWKYSASLCQFELMRNLAFQRSPELRSFLPLEYEKESHFLAHLGCVVEGVVCARMPGAGMSLPSIDRVRRLYAASDRLYPRLPWIVVFDRACVELLSGKAEPALGFLYEAMGRVEEQDPKLGGKIADWIRSFAAVVKSDPHRWIAQTPPTNVIPYVIYREGRKEPFSQWLALIRDSVAKLAIGQRLERFRLGDYGEWQKVGAGILETRIHAGPGYRVYFVPGTSFDAPTVILCGAMKGKRKQQDDDIDTAKGYWRKYKRQYP